MISEKEINKLVSLANGELSSEPLIMAYQAPWVIRYFYIVKNRLQYLEKLRKAGDYDDYSSQLVRIFEYEDVQNELRFRNRLFCSEFAKSLVSANDFGPNYIDRIKFAERWRIGYGFKGLNDITMKFEDGQINISIPVQLMKDSRKKILDIVDSACEFFGQVKLDQAMTTEIKTNDEFTDIIFGRAESILENILEIREGKLLIKTLTFETESTIQVGTDPSDIFSNVLDITRPISRKVMTKEEFEKVNLEVYEKQRSVLNEFLEQFIANTENAYRRIPTRKILNMYYTKIDIYDKRKNKGEYSWKKLAKLYDIDESSVREAYRTVQKLIETGVRETPPFPSTPTETNPVLTIEMK